MLCDMRHSFSNLAYVMFAESLCFIKNKLSLYVILKVFTFSLLVFRKFMAPVGLPTLTMNLLCVTVLWTLISHDHRHFNLHR